jgi:hypothetical protein
VQAAARAQTHGPSRSFEAARAGILALTFDNAHSLFTPKQLTLHYEITPAPAGRTAQDRTAQLHAASLEMQKQGMGRLTRKQERPRGHSGRARSLAVFARM